MSDARMDYANCHFTTKELADEMELLTFSTRMAIQGTRNPKLADDFRLRLAKQVAITKLVLAAEAAKKGT